MFKKIIRQLKFQSINNFQLQTGNSTAINIVFIFYDRT